MPRPSPTGWSGPSSSAYGCGAAAGGCGGADSETVARVSDPASAAEATVTRAVREDGIDEPPAGNGPSDLLDRTGVAEEEALGVRKADVHADVGFFCGLDAFRHRVDEQLSGDGDERAEQALSRERGGADAA